MRVKLAARGAGRWQSSGGYRSKFGLTVTEMLRGVRVPEAARHGRLLPAAPLPPRQPDHEHPQRQERADRGGPRLHRAGQAGRRAQVPRRRRRPGHRLRRLADQLRVVDQLHAAGVRQRRRVPHQEGLRRGGVPHPTIVSESGRAVSAYHSVLSSTCSARSSFDDEQIPDEGRATTPSSRSCDLFETYQRSRSRTCSSATTTRSRRSTRR